LTITRQIVDLHGGRIAIRSTQEEGTTVEITLPAASSGTESYRGPGG